MIAEANLNVGLTSAGVEETLVGAAESGQESVDLGGLVARLGEVVGEASARERDSDLRVDLDSTTNGSNEWA